MSGISQQTKAAFLVCFVEGWERFSYYGMRALLVLYLTSRLGFQDAKAYTIYSLFAAIGYAIPVLAGVLADRFLGFQRTLILGGFILCLGHLALALSFDQHTFVYFGLALITIGTGFFKGNVTNLLGTLFTPLEPGRDSAFTWFYVSVNVGGAIAAIICGFVAKAYGWHYGFGLAGLGMFLGMLAFLKYRFLLGHHGLKPNKQMNNLSTPMINVTTQSILLAFVLCAGSFFMLSNAEIATPYFAKSGMIIVAILFFVFSRHTPEERKDMAALCILTFFILCFFAIEMQLGSFVNLFTERNVNRFVFGIEIPAASLQSINPISVVTLGALFAGIFSKLGATWSMKRFILGLLTNVLCFAVIYIGCLNAQDGNVSILYLIAGMLLMGFSEIAMVPVVQSLMTVLSPVAIRGFMMGFLMFSLSYSNLIGLFVSKFMAIPKEETGNKLLSLSIYQTGFFNIMIGSLLMVLLFIFFMPWLTRRLRMIQN